MTNVSLEVELDLITDSAALMAPVFEKWLRKLCSVTDSMVLGAEFSSDNHLCIMATQFNAKQLGHTEAILILGDHVDTLLIARSMLEGLCLLKWAIQEPNTRPSQWRHYAYVIEWRRCWIDKISNLPGSDKKLIELANRIAENGDTFLNNKALEAQSKGEPLPNDPYIKTWYRPQLRQIFEAVGNGALYENSYFFMSEWHHWSPGGLAQAVHQEGAEMSYSGRSSVVQAHALQTAFHCIAETALIVDQYLALDRTDDITEIIKSLTDEIEAVNSVDVSSNSEI